MKSRIEQEINKTLDCFDDDIDICVSSVFAGKLNSRIAGIRPACSLGCRNRAFYHVAILLMVLLNVIAVFNTFGDLSQTRSDDSDQQLYVLATEYGIGQTMEMGIIGYDHGFLHKK